MVHGCGAKMATTMPQPLADLGAEQSRDDGMHGMHGMHGMQGSIHPNHGSQ
jgi:hypothetical protein